MSDNEGSTQRKDDVLIVRMKDKSVNNFAYINGNE